MNHEFERTYAELLSRAHNEFRVPLKRACNWLSLPYSTVANKRNKGTWPQDRLRIDDDGINDKLYVSVFQLAQVLSGCKNVTDVKEILLAPRGAPSLAERQAAERAGVSVKELRARATGGEE